MGKIKNNFIKELEKLALIAESVQTLFNGKGSIIFELEKEEYDNVIKNFREIDRQRKFFSIDISGTEFHFILIEET